jgi:hypothetical protein
MEINSPLEFWAQPPSIYRLLLHRAHGRNRLGAQLLKLSVSVRAAVAAEAVGARQQVFVAAVARAVVVVGHAPCSQLQH